MLHILARDYSSYKYVDESNQDLDLSLCPIANRMFHGDKASEYCSPYRTKNIPGILVIGKTYGSTNKPLYKFIPDSKHLPIFLVPYEIKASFNKAYKNKYAVITFKEWNREHPIGSLVETLGDVDSLEAFCEYQLHRRNLVHSMAKFTSHVKTVLKDEAQCIATIQQRHQVPEITGEYVFSIDPATSLDYDDAFSVKQTGESRFRVTVHIANVYLWLETFDLFKYLTGRVSTIYLPDKKRPMLPTLLSDNYCSLKAGAKRFVYTYSQEFESGQPIGEPQFGSGLVKINKNCAYDDPDLDKVNGYNTLKKISGCADSHDVVAYWMVKMNVECAKRGTKIYRGTVHDDECISAKYSLQPLEHRSLNESRYTHITSPIRRLVDIINQASGSELIEWTDRLDYINEQCRQIKRAQMDCNLLAFSLNAIHDAVYEGTIVDVFESEYYVHSEYSVQFTSGLRARFKSTEKYEIGSVHQFKIYVFNDEHTLCKKVQLILQR